MPMPIDNALTPIPYELTEGLPLVKDDFLAVAAGLNRLLSAEGAAFSERLAGGAAWLGMLEMFARQAGVQIGLSQHDLVLKYIEMTEKSGFSQALRIGQAKRKGPAYLQRMYLGTLAAFRNETDKKRGALGAFRIIVWSYFKSALRLGKIRLAPLENAIPCREFRSIAFDPDSVAALPLLQGLIKEMTVGDVLLECRDLTRGFYLALTAYAVCRWYAVGLAAERQAGEVSTGDLEKAIELTRSHYGLSPEFLGIFERYPVVNGILYNICRRKNFAHALVAWPV
jgi:hypothetical protein